MEHVKTKRKKTKAKESLSTQDFSVILKKAGEKAKKDAFKENLPVPVLIDGEIFFEYPDGTLVKKTEKESLKN